jgi:hypothetical protein
VKQLVKKLRFLAWPLLPLALIPALAFCKSDLLPDDPERTYAESVQRVVFTDDTATMVLDKLDQNDIFLIRVNKSGQVAPASITGRVHNWQTSPPPRGHPQARCFSGKLPPVSEEMLRYMTASVHRLSVRQRPGEQKLFWVENFFTSGIFVQKTATLKATGKHGNIWVMDDNRREISTSQANLIAERFDLIYFFSTNLLGFEFGGGPGGSGGRDRDPKVQILVYDIVDQNGSSSASGYFWGKDYFPQSFIDNAGLNIKSNLAEIIYLNTYTFLANPDYFYTTLVHELQHMINFNMKDIRQGNKRTPLWYNEMLSAMAEDVISPLIGIPMENRFHPAQERMPIFLGSYNHSGVTEWEFTLSNYAVFYAFGAYLMRNFGGPALLKEILANNSTGTRSLSAALKKVSGVTFDEALSRFGEALVFSGDSIPKGAMSFDKTVSSRIGGINYTAYGFDIWSMRQIWANVMGPAVFELGLRDMRPHSVLLKSNKSWRNVSGCLAILLQKPDNEDIELYLIVKEVDR